LRARFPWLTLSIAVIWVGLYYGFLNDLSPESKRHALLLLGGKARAHVLDGGETWRLLSSAFLHHSSFHLWSNVAGLMALGIYLENQVHRLEWFALTLIVTTVAMGDDLWWHEGITVGGSVIVFAWAGSLFGFAFKRKRVFANLPMLMALTAYLAAALWIGSQMSNIAHRTHLIALCLGFVLGMQLQMRQEKITRPILAIFSLLVLVFLFMGQDALRDYRSKTQSVKIVEMGLRMEIPTFWDIFEEADQIRITNATDVVLWGHCQVEQHPPSPERVIEQFLTDQLFLPQVFGVANDIKFKPARVFQSQEGRELEGYQVPFSFVGTQGHYDGLYHLWVFGLTRCVVVSTSWSKLEPVSNMLLQEVLSSMHIESIIEPLPNGNYFDQLNAAQKAYEMGEAVSYQQSIQQLEKSDHADKGRYYLLRAKEALVMQKDVQEARTWGLKALDSLPAEREVVLLVAGLLLQNGEVRLARQVLMHAHLISGQFMDWLEKTRWLIP
jgi:rhomboid protease GluP